MDSDRLKSAVHSLSMDNQHATLTPYGICETYWAIGAAVEAVSDHDRVTVSAATLGNMGSTRNSPYCTVDGLVDLRVVVHCWICKRNIDSTTCSVLANLALSSLPRIIYPLCLDMVAQPCWNMEDQSACAAWLATWCRDRGSEGVTVAEAYNAAQEKAICPPGRLEWIIRKLDLDLEHACEGGYWFWSETGEKFVPVPSTLTMREMKAPLVRIEHRGRLLTLPVGHPWRNW